MRKPKYEVGDYVRIKSNLKVNYVEGLVPIMVDMAGQLVQISCVDSDDIDEDDMAYVVKELKDYYWREDWFEYRLGNYNDNTKSDFTYVIGYSYKDVTHTFEGRIENFDLNGKSTFIDKNGKILMIPYKDIAYIMPIED